jgi:hypothetical protein
VVKNDRADEDLALRFSQLAFAGSSTIFPATGGVATQYTKHGRYRRGGKSQYEIVRNSELSVFRLVRLSTYDRLLNARPCRRGWS